MAHLNVNFDETPDKFESLPAGVYEFEVLSVGEPEPNSKNTGQKVVVELKVVNNDKHNDRKQSAHISLKNPVLLKQLSKSCGLKWDAAGGDTTDLVGKVCKGQVKAGTYTDKDTGETKESSNIAAFLF